MVCVRTAQSNSDFFCELNGVFVGRSDLTQCNVGQPVDRRETALAAECQIKQ